jgi:hypothetical protein
MLLPSPNSRTTVLPPYSPSKDSSSYSPKSSGINKDSFNPRLRTYSESTATLDMATLDTATLGTVRAAELAIVVCFFFATRIVKAESPSPIVPFIDRYCVQCHDAGSAEAGLDLSRLGDGRSEVGFDDQMVQVYDRIVAHEMPPADAEQPEGSERESVVTALASYLLSSNRKQQQEHGRTELRRLNRTEYANSLRELLRMPQLDVRDEFPPDGEASGFDNVSSGLELSEIQMTRYLEVADSALRQAVARYPKPESSIQRYEFEKEGRFMPRDKTTGKPDPRGRGSSRVVGDSIVFLRQPNQAQTPWFFGRSLPESGRYRVRIRCQGVQYNNGSLEPSYIPHIAALVTNHSKRKLVEFDVPRQADVIESDIWIEAGDQFTFRASSLDGRGSPGEDVIPDKPYAGPGIAVDYVEVEGPVVETWPPPSHQALFGDLPLATWSEQSKVRKPSFGLDYRGKPITDPPLIVVSKNPLVDAKKLIERFMSEAWRRPVTGGEVARYLKRFQKQSKAGYSFDESLLSAYKAVLYAPEFLFLDEKPGRLSSHAVANRLSYFLWRSPPDARLRQTADRDELKSATAIRREAERMMNDPKFERFVEDFLGQWLELRRIRFTEPDKQLYPEFDLLMLEGMVDETRRFFHAMVEENLPIRNIIDSEFVWINGPLSKLYEIDGVEGCQLQRVSIPIEHVRGGFLTQASVLKITANGTTTSPVTRGAWINQRLLGKVIPPPPPNAGSVEPDVRGTTTIREQLDKHRSNESCAGCHRKIDPVGFALESFDVMGGYRDRYRTLDKGEIVDKSFADRPVKYRSGPVVDSTGETEDGRTFHDVNEFRGILMEDEESLARNLVHRLTVFATGASIQFADRQIIEAILAEHRAAGYPTRDLILSIVSSPMFINK